MLTVIARCGLALQSIIQGDGRTAAEQYDALQLVQGIMVPFYIAGDRVLGILSQVIGDLGQTVVHFDDALAFSRS